MSHVLASPAETPESGDSSSSVQRRPLLTPSDARCTFDEDSPENHSDVDEQSWQSRRTIVASSQNPLVPPAVCQPEVPPGQPAGHQASASSTPRPLRGPPPSSGRPTCSTTSAQQGAAPAITPRLSSPRRHEDHTPHTISTIGLRHCVAVYGRQFEQEQSRGGPSQLGGVLHRVVPPPASSPFSPRPPWAPPPPANEDVHHLYLSRAEQARLTKRRHAQAAVDTENAWSQKRISDVASKLPRARWAREEKKVVEKKREIQARARQTVVARTLLVGELCRR